MTIVMKHYGINTGESTMPPKSEKQRRAMAAAAHGKSNIGIPKSVGQEFMAADKGGKLPMKKGFKGKSKK